MLNNIATKISNIIIQKCQLSSDLIKIYTYGCELLISTGLGMMSVFLISCLLGRPLSGIIFLIVFVSLRLFCGGLHASTYLKCFILSNLIFLSVYSLSWGLTYVSWFLSVLLLLISFIVIFAFAPIRNVNHPLSDERYIRNKRISRVLVFTEMIVILAIYTIIRNIYFLSIASTSMFAVSFMMLIPKICQARRVRYE